MISLADVLSSHLKPLCSRDNHVMKYLPTACRSNAENQPSYHCGSGAKNPAVSCFSKH
jgi:hypothetical protein